MFLVRDAQAGEMPCESHWYRLLWTASGPENENRKLLILPPGVPVVHSLDRTGHIVSFPEETLVMLGLQGYPPFPATSALPKTRNAVVDLKTCEMGKTIERTISNLKTECQRLPKGDMLLSGLFKVLLVSVSRIFQQIEPEENNSADHQLFQRFMHLVAQHNVNRKGIQDYARALCVRSEVLSETIKRVSGYPASHHIYEHIIRSAKNAAIGSGSSMKEVAFGLGFKDVAHFSKFFLNKSGMTFSEYKKAYQTL